MSASIPIAHPASGMESARALVSSTSKGYWGLDALRGRVVEVSGGAETAALTTAARLILETQMQGHAAAWVGERRTGFYPPDFAACGIDLGAVPVVRVDALERRLKALDALLRSGGFALILLDLGHERIPLGMQSRLAGLAKHHHAALILLTRSQGNAPSGNTLASLRCDTRKERTLAHQFTCRLEVVKDKSGPLGWEHEEVGNAPDGVG